MGCISDVVIDGNKINLASNNRAVAVQAGTLIYFITWASFWEVLPKRYIKFKDVLVSHNVKQTAARTVVNVSICGWDLSVAANLRIYHQDA